MIILLSYSNYSKIFSQLLLDFVHSTDDYRSCFIQILTSIVEQLLEFVLLGLQIVILLPFCLTPHKCVTLWWVLAFFLFGSIYLECFFYTTCFLTSVFFHVLYTKINVFKYIYHLLYFLGNLKNFRWCTTKLDINMSIYVFIFK